MVEQVVHRLDMAVHHGGRGLEAAAVRLAMNLEPRLRPALLRRDARAHARREHLGAAAGDGALAGVPETIEDVGEPQPGHLGHRVDLGGREEVRRDLGEASPRLADDGQVVLEGQRGVVAALQEHGGRSLRGRGADLGQYLVDGERPRLGITWLAVERAELAVGHADVRVIRIRVHDERHDLARDAPGADRGGQRADFQEGRLGQQEPAGLAVQALAVERLIADAAERGVDAHR